MLQIEAHPIVEAQELLGCIQCGKCTAGCPMATKTKLNPRILILRLITAPDGFDLEGRDELWDCTTCATCSSRCPKLVNPMETIIRLRGAFVEQGRVHPNVKTALESTFRQGNPLTMPREDRAAWASGLDLRKMQAGVEYLYFVGCTPSYDPRVQKATRSLVALMKKGGVDFGILGVEESCCASEVRRLGEAGLFEMMVEENQEKFQAAGVKKMFTTSPHCFNVFRNDYPKGSGIEVRHYTQVLAEAIEKKNLEFSGRFEKKVTYHDPCYLGRHNGIFDEPRAVLAGVPGVKLVEMDRSRQKSLCCEGGGGRMWLEGTNPGVRLAQSRIKEALDTGAEVLATACPFCLLTLEEAAKQLNVEDRLRVMDIAEIAAEAL